MHEKFKDFLGAPGEKARDETLSYPKWCSRLVSSVIRIRCTFSAFLAFAIKTSRTKPDRLSPAPTFFPIPVTSWGLFDGKPASTPSRNSHRHSLLDKVVFVMAMALNFWHSGGKFAEKDELRRGLNTQQVKLVQHLRALVKSDDPELQFPICKAGRRFPELVARLSELSEFVTTTGIASGPYTKTFQGKGEVVEPDNTVMAELEPYRDLNASRLKLSGAGSWDMTNYLHDELVMVYRDPRVLEFGAQPSNCPVIRDKPGEIFELARRWDQQGLLVAHCSDRPLHRPGELVRIFNAFKSADFDRQIGDRRGRNSVEQKVTGPSRWLPAAVDLQDLLCRPEDQKLAISITDRKDFYHQIKATKSRAMTNTVGPGIPTSWFEELSVWPDLLKLKKSKRYRREEDGDLLGKPKASATPGLPATSWVSFGSVLQGDRAGVDLATQGHVQLLKDAGLLTEECRVQAHSPLRSGCEAQGLVIDDFFCVTVEKATTQPSSSRSAKVLRRASEAYEVAGIIGSPEKDIDAEDSGKVIGGFLNSSERARKNGLVTLGPTLQRKLALAYVTLSVCALGHTTDSLHVCIMGAWVSLLMFRRPMMAVLGAAFRFVDFNAIDPQKPRILKLTRKVKDELTLLACLVPLMTTEISAPYHPWVYATDASSTRGAVVRCKPGADIAEVLWKSCRTKGSYTRFRTEQQQLLRRLGQDDEEEPYVERCQRPLAFRFSFIEIYSGASDVTRFVAELGYSVGPCIDLSDSPEYDMRFVHVASWLCYLCAEGHLKGLMLEPPCTTFSIMRRPQLRSLDLPYGFDPDDPATRLGTILAQRAFQVLKTARINDVAGILETTYASRLRALPSYVAIKEDPASDECRTDSCRFGSIHMKPFRFLSVHAPLRRLSKRCTCSGKHVKVEGAYTKASATYVTDLAKELATTICIAMRAKEILEDKEDEVSVKGLENQLVNQTAETEDWETIYSWKFKRRSHINILELSSVLKMVMHVAKEGGHCRVSSLADSAVVRGAVSKGRSSSKGLNALLNKIGAMLVAFGIYITIPFCPTRLNISDDPTRGKELRKPCGSRLTDIKDEIFEQALLPGLRRWASNWARLALFLAGPRLLYLRDRAVFRKAEKGPSAIAALFNAASMDFDQTLGYPGEGPTESSPTAASLPTAVAMDFDQTLLLPGGGPEDSEMSSSGTAISLGGGSQSVLGLLWICFVLWIFIVSWIFPRLCSALSFLFCFCLSHLRSSSHSGTRVLVLLSVLGSAMEVSAMPLFPRNAGDEARALARSLRPQPTVTRPVLPVTTALREKHAEVFDTWLNENGIDFNIMLDRHFECIEEINMVLVRFGKTLFEAGRPYNHYLETINMVVAKKPLLRRMLQTAWDYAFSWVKQEPSAHHVAMPFQVVMACISVAIAWGWDRVAGSLALMWGALLRAGEFLTAYIGLNCFCLQMFKTVWVTPCFRFQSRKRECLQLDTRLGSLTFQTF